MYLESNFSTHGTSFPSRFFPIDYDLREKNNNCNSFPCCYVKPPTSLPSINYGLVLIIRHVAIKIKISISREENEDAILNAVQLWIGQRLGREFRF
jgi:hypothetical protein